jgi:ubiquinone/menaquinone biosynthesis C-methylase UbiE
MEDNVNASTSDDQRDVNAYFDAAAPYWDRVYVGEELQDVIYQRRQDAVLAAVDAAAPGPGARGLEIGSGAGRLTVELARRGLRLDTLDASAAMVQATAATLAEAGLREGVGIQQADVHALPFPDAEFDLVVAVGVLPWLHSPQRALVEMSRVLRPGGQLVMTADNRARLTSFTDPRRVLAVPPLKRLYRQVRRREPLAVSRMHWPREVDRMLSTAGLRPLSRSTIGFGPFSLMGRSLLEGRSGVRLGDRLQRLADAGVPGFRGTGWHYLVRAVKQ